MLLDGKKVSDLIKNNIKTRVSKFEVKPRLVVILIGNSDASKVYVRNKIKACDKVGIDSEVITFDDIEESKLIDLIHTLNNTSEVTGILVQLPLPDHIDTNKIITAIDPKKDVDGFHPINIGKTMLNLESVISCTPKGIIRILKYYNIPIEGKNVVIIGRSNIVGKPLAALFINEGASLSILNSKTKNIKMYTRQADILVSAIGKAKFIDDSYIKKDTVVIDVGINRDENGNLCGDIDFIKIKDKVKFLTPVPGGVGPMTIAMLLENCIELKEKYGSI